MNKKILLILTFILGMSLMFTACGKGEAENTALQKAAAKEIGDYLISNLKFEDELSKVDSDMVKELYLLTKDDISDNALYIPTYTSEEVGVLKVDGDLEKVKKAVEERIEIQKASFGVYRPEELGKLENAYVYAEGNTVILIVSSDKEAAKKAVENFGKQ